LLPFNAEIVLLARAKKSLIALSSLTKERWDNKPTVDSLKAVNYNIKKQVNITN